MEDSFQKIQSTLIQENLLLKRRIKELEQAESDHKHNEEHLGLALQRLRSHTENSPLAVVEFDLEFRVTYWSKQTEHVFGWSAEEILGKRIAEIKWVHEDDVERVSKLSADMFCGRSTSNVHTNRNYRKDGSIITCVWYNSALLSPQGVLISVRSAVLDITSQEKAEKALTESEERFRAFMDNSPAIAWAKDEQGRHTYLNRAYEKRFSVRIEDLRGKTDFELWPQGTARDFRDDDLTVLASGRTHEMIRELADTDGVRSFWWVFKFPFQDTSGKRYVGGIGVDITERKKMEQQLKDHKEHLEKLVEERTNELRIKSRNLEEVNTALKVLLEQREKDKNLMEENILFNVKKLVLPYLDTLKQKRLTEEQQSYLDVLETNLNNIISPFTKRLTSIHDSLTPQEIKVADFIRNGKTVKEIAAILGVSESAINRHRQHIRNKLGLNNQKVNLRTYLLSLT